MIGSQTPSGLWVEPERVGSVGGDAAELMAAYMSPPDPWQRLILDCWMGFGSDKHYTMATGGLLVPRQNGKNFCIEARELYGLLVDGEKILHTAHQVKTAKQSFRRLATVFESDDHPEIKAMVKAIRYTNGEETVELINGGVIKYCARSRQAARGFDGLSLVIFDEAQELTDDQIEAILPVLAACNGDRQVIYAGTPHYPSCPGTVFRRMRKAAQTNPTKSAAWHEWSVTADSIDKIDVENVELWYKCNPEMGLHLSEQHTRETEFEMMSPDGFARERLGWSMPIFEDEQVTVIKPDAWQACATQVPKTAGGKTAYGVKFSLDGREVVLCGAQQKPSEPCRIAVIERWDIATGGIMQAAQWLKPRCETASCVVIDGDTYAPTLIQLIRETWLWKNSIIWARAADAVAAAGMLAEAVTEKRICYNPAQKTLTESAITSTKRQVGRRGWAFGGDNSAPIEAAALAYYGVMTSKRDPTVEQRIG